MTKLTCFLFFVFLCVNYLQSQTTENSGAIRQKISVKQYQGKKVEVEAAAKTNQLDSKAGAVLFFKVQKKNKQPGLLLLSKTSIVKNSWNEYTLEGVLDADADSLSFGIIFQGKAVYSFDNFIIRIDGKEIPLNDYDFESSVQFPNEVWTAPLLPPGFTAKLSTDNVYKGKQSLVIDGTNVKKINKIGDNDSTGKYAEINGIKLYYEIYGSGEPLLLLHGNQQSIGVFNSQVTEFSKYYKVIAVDTRGQGKSTTDGKNYTYDLFAEDMNLLLAYLNIEQANVVGWSDGGNTGLIMAMKYPKRVKKLVTMGACIFINNTVVDEAVLKEVNKQISQLGKNATPGKENSSRLYTMLLTEPKHQFEELKSITCPALIIAGEDDIIKPEHTKGIAAGIPGSQLLIAAKQTHYYPVEDAKSFNEVVLNFLRRK